MQLIRKQKNIHLFISFFLVFNLFISGCLDRSEPKPEETNLPSLQRQDLVSIQQQTLNWFGQYLNTYREEISQSSDQGLIEQIRTSRLLLTFDQKNLSYTQVLNKTIQEILESYDQNQANQTLYTTSQLLILLHNAPSSYSSLAMKDELADHILSFKNQNNTFNTTPVLSKEAASGLTALIIHYSSTSNESTYEPLVELITTYYSLLTQYHKNHNVSNDTNFENQEYTNHYFTIPFSKIYSFNDSRVDSYQLIYVVNEALSKFQETQDKQHLGQFISYNQTDPLLYQVEAIQSMMIGYTLSQKDQRFHNDTLFKQSLILGLIHLKNTISANTSVILTTQQHLVLLPVIHEVLTMLPSTNWTYLWDSSNQLLLEGRSLETSPTLWTALTIGVMGSIGLLSLVFIIIRLYYKNKL